MSNEDLLRSEMDRQGVTDNDLRAGIAAIAMGESLMTPHTETDYAHTNNARIRSIFGARVAGLTEAALNILKADPKAFFNRVYGGEWGKTNLGNTQPNDGYTYRGRTMLQLTGRANYAKLEEMTSYPIVASPDIANQPQVSAAIAVAYMRWRYLGGGWAAMKAAVGNNTPDIDATKNKYYQQFKASGEFNYKPMTPDQGEGGDLGETPNVVLKVFDAQVRAVQSELKVLKLYDGKIDGDFGEGSRAAYRKWLGVK